MNHAEKCPVCEGTGNARPPKIRTIKTPSGEYVVEERSGIIVAAECSTAASREDAAWAACERLRKQ